MSTNQLLSEACPTVASVTNSTTNKKSNSDISANS